jgi:hypothetical protein
VELVSGVYCGTQHSLGVSPAPRLHPAFAFGPVSTVRNSITNPLSDLSRPGGLVGLFPRRSSISLSLDIVGVQLAVCLSYISSVVLRR